jgi:hypothetical protein
MTGFQIFAVSCFALFAVATVRNAIRGRIRKRIATFWLLVWLGAAGTVMWPQATVTLARAVGIGRGADLVAYTSVVVMLGGFFYIYTRFRRLDRQITLLVRRLALENPHKPDDER